MEINSWTVLRCNFKKEVAVEVLLSHQSQHGGGIGVTKGRVSL